MKFLSDYVLFPKLPRTRRSAGRVKPCQMSEVIGSAEEAHGGQGVLGWKGDGLANAGCSDRL